MHYQIFLTKTHLNRKLQCTWEVCIWTPILWQVCQIDALCQHNDSLHIFLSLGYLCNALVICSNVAYKALQTNNPPFCGSNAVSGSHLQSKQLHSCLQQVNIFALPGAKDPSHFIYKLTVHTVGPFPCVCSARYIVFPC